MDKHGGSFNKSIVYPFYFFIIMSTVLELLGLQHVHCVVTL